ncbi:NADH dehydrogenase [ubiquinone] 1 alpha subcomplex subunit 8-like [Amphibalanus amphitrite]|uniref:NADH dehydrogenase [ubiquinone] 1 alpha subcomplex subunit 8-like n=1 Tax=Amphibalanus amphitrite TaxID=1232801 RepID=UPI001C9253E3|nr:NADH dehydrogenase [ubiquinone] 1 alpha subcomplex subunit 8-like [Amphibalanus amphitrite]
MPVTLDTYLPSEQELTVEELNIGYPALKAGSFHLGKYCEAQRDEFMLCRQEEKDPRKCLAEGRAVTSCALEFFRKVKSTCMDEFNQYANCLDRGSPDLKFRMCRNTQSVFDKCVQDNMGMERPYYGYFCAPKVIRTNRPRPAPEPPLEFPNTPDELPDTMPRKPAPYSQGGGRQFF